MDNGKRVPDDHKKKIIFVYARVPDELRSDNTPELMQGIVRQVVNT